VRARHNDIQKIERTLLELNQLMEDLATAIVLQEEPIQQVEQQTENVKKDTEAGNVQLDKGIRSARNARRLKWWCLGICVAIAVILGLVLGLYFGLPSSPGHPKAKAKRAVLFPSSRSPAIVHGRVWRRGQLDGGAYA